MPLILGESIETATEEPPGAMKPDESGDDTALDSLMVQYQGGDWQAFEQLYRGLKEPLLRYLRWRVGDPARAEDLLQQTFLQVHRSRQTFLPGRSARAWLYGVARNVLLMDQRTRYRKTGRELPLDHAATEKSASPSSQIADRQLLERALRVLTPEQAEAFLLHEVHGFTFPEIAGILGIRSGTAKLRAFRASRAVQAELERLGVTSELLATKKTT